MIVPKSFSNKRMIIRLLASDAFLMQLNDYAYGTPFRTGIMAATQCQGPVIKVSKWFV